MRLLITAFIIGGLITLTPDTTQAAGDLLVSPTRLVLDGGTTHASVTLVNTGTETATYRLSFVRMRMTEEGHLITIDGQEAAESGEAFADPFIVFSPRQVTLPPRTPQAVRLAIRKPPGLDDGEYRSHLLMQAVPTASSQIDPGESDSAEGELAIRLTAIYGVSIPVIVRHGATFATSEVDDLELHLPQESGDAPSLSLRLKRSGNRSLYGDLTVTHYSDAGHESELASLRGIAVYVPLGSRVVQIQLSPPPHIQLNEGRIKVTFQERAEFGGSSRVEKWLDTP